MFNKQVLQVHQALANGNIALARELLDSQIWPLAGKDQVLRKIAHDLANTIQAAVFEQYLVQ